MTTRPAWLSCLALLTAGCSDGTEPNVPPGGTFTMQLAGARQAAMTGTSNASTVFTEIGTEYVIRMFAQEGRKLRSVLIRCPGEEAPGEGLHVLGDSAAGCRGSYALVDSTFTVLEEALATSGNLSILPSGPDELRGVFNFQAPLVVGSDNSGGVTASGSFRADLLLRSPL